MDTAHWLVDIHVNNEKMNQQLEQAANLLRRNEVVAFPTETVYGLGANATSKQAVAKIFHAKGRPSDNPLIVHIADEKQLTGLVKRVPDSAQKLIDAFWPGPLTIIFEKKEDVLPDIVTAGLKTVAIRMPDHPIALTLIKKARLPIAAPSANRSGKPSPTTAQHVIDDLNGFIAGVVDGGATGVGVESTVVDSTTEDTPIILRPGGISKEAIEKVIGKMTNDPALEGHNNQPKSPGMKYMHYAPEVPLYLMDGDLYERQKIIAQKKSAGLKVGVIATEESASAYDADVVIPCGKREDLHTVAYRLYDTLRSFRKEDVDIILTEVFPYKGVGTAIMNRLEKASGHRWVRKEE